MPYTIDLHQHRLAAWAAATAARASRNCRFTVRVGAAILEEAGFAADFRMPMVENAEAMDRAHSEWRDKIIEKARIRNVTMSDGVAAKLVNVYLKCRFVCGGHHTDPVAALLHPPIDRELLSALADSDLAGKRNEWTRYRNIGWSNFTREQYESVIESIREALKPNPLWQIEEHWIGYQQGG